MVEIETHATNKIWEKIEDINQLSKSLGIVSTGFINFIVYNKNTYKKKFVNNRYR